MEQMNLRDTTGFTLLETLVAMTILAFGLMAIVAMVDVSQNAATLSKNSTRATQIATWMIDRIIMETSLVSQPYASDLAKLQSFDNDASALIRCDTSIAGDPLNEPGRTVCREWRDAIRGIFRQGEAALQNASTALPNGVGVLTITPNDPAWAQNHTAEVMVTWQTYTSTLLQTRRRVTMRTMLPNVN